MLKKAEYLADREFKVGEVDEKVFSSFAEHLGRCIYSGLYEPGHPEADEQGFRKDTIKLVKELGVPMVRYPGGNFVSCFDWTDSIGPKEERPRRMDYAWASIETNEFGLDEFVDWAKKAGIEPMMAVNLGTDSIRSAGYLVEYCNHPGGTYWSDLRIKNGHKEPYNIKYWCLGNEMEGPWQAGHLSAEDYAKKALEAAKVMRWVDPSIKLIASGSSYEMLSSYLDWDRTILMELYDHIDYISTHAYYMNKNNCVGTTNYLASYKQLDTHLKATQTALDFVQAKTAKKKTVEICLDEWNVWNFSDIVFNSMSDLIGMTTFKMTSAEPWEIAPSILEEKYSLLDALVLGGLAITLLQHVDRVKIACLAQLVNVIAPITTKRNGGILKQSTFYPFLYMSQYGRGEVVKSVVKAPEYVSMYGNLPVVEAVTVYNPEDSTATVFALNCDQEESVEFRAELNHFGSVTLVQHIVLDGSDLEATNTFEDPENVVPREIAVGAAEAKSLTTVLPKLSWNVLRYSVDKQ
ncbi:MAG: alpha-L-arabinofuranosidase [Caproiciproducens sp.]|nr:alpha-L-arabinofuranosidase [Caproiciproducens sp.]